MMDWKECLGRKLVKDIGEDNELIKSLVKSSIGKLESSDELEMKEVAAASKLSLAYDSLREILEALSIKEGYKIYNHECFTAFLKEILSESEKGDIFDEIRKIRNNVNYYGKEILVDEANEVIRRIKKLRKELYEFLEK